MTLALWCDAKDAGHSFSDQAAIVVVSQKITFHFCGPHTYDAFKKAMVITGTERECRMHYPPVGDIVLTCDNPVTPIFRGNEVSAQPTPPAKKPTEAVPSAEPGAPRVP